MNQLLLALILSFLPISELRGGMLLAVNYALKNNINLAFVFFLVVIINILAIFFVFIFLDNVHKKLLKFKFYKNISESYLGMVRKKVQKVEKKYSLYGFLALTLFVAAPIPTTGAWTGTIIAWILNLERKKSILSISLGVLIAGIIMFLASFGFIKLFF